MAAFDYRALEGERAVRGVVQAESARQARTLLRERGLVPLDVEPVRPGRRRGGAGMARERALILRQLAALLRAGLPQEEALSLVAEHSERRGVRRAMAAIRARVREGAALSEAMAEQPALFPAMIHRTVAAGEQAGQLDRVVERLAENAEQRQALARGLGVALVYPAVLALVSLAVVWGLLAFVVPRVVVVFEQSGQDLPWMTTSLIAVSGFLSEHAVALLAGLLVAVVACGILLRTEPVRERVDAWMLRLPGVGRIVRLHAAALFARTLAILMASGVPAVEALNTAAGVSANRRVRADLQRAARRVREGAAIATALDVVDWLPPLTRRLVRGGERAGDLSSMLDHAAALQERDLADAGQVLLTVLQPLMIVVVGGIVLYIVLAILLPIMNMSQLLS
ncbi:MAG: type II secretion system F family protein [Wenzhouxiangellaceae bacterium]|nr:type II secretion system F family protein [Wenzhouxiangellaceae bacterium]